MFLYRVWEPRITPMATGHPQGVPLRKFLFLRARLVVTCRGRSCADPGSIGAARMDLSTSPSSGQRVKPLARVKLSANQSLFAASHYANENIFLFQK